MTKPRTRDEAHLRRRFEHEDEIPYEIEREARENKRIWKRKTSKLHRSNAKKELRRALEENDD